MRIDFSYKMGTRNQFRIDESAVWTPIHRVRIIRGTGQEDIVLTAVHDLSGRTIEVDADCVKMRRKPCNDAIYCLKEKEQTSLCIKASAIKEGYTAPVLHIDAPNFCITGNYTLGGVGFSYTEKHWIFEWRDLMQNYMRAIQALQHSKTQAEFDVNNETTKTAFKAMMAFQENLQNYTVEKYLAGEAL